MPNKKVEHDEAEPQPTARVTRAKCTTPTVVASPRRVSQRLLSDKKEPVKEQVISSSTSTPTKTALTKQPKAAVKKLEDKPKAAATPKKNSSEQCEKPKVIDPKTKVECSTPQRTTRRRTRSQQTDDVLDDHIQQESGTSSPEGNEISVNGTPKHKKNDEGNKKVPLKGKKKLELIAEKDETHEEDANGTTENDGDVHNIETSVNNKEKNQDNKEKQQVEECAQNKINESKEGAISESKLVEKLNSGSEQSVDTGETVMEHESDAKNDVEKVTEDIEKESNEETKVETSEKQSSPSVEKVTEDKSDPNVKLDKKTDEGLKETLGQKESCKLEESDKCTESTAMEVDKTCPMTEEKQGVECDTGIVDDIKEGSIINKNENPVETKTLIQNESSLNIVINEAVKNEALIEQEDQPKKEEPTQPSPTDKGKNEQEKSMEEEHIETKTEENQLKMEQDVVENEPKKGEPVKPSPTDKGKNEQEKSMEEEHIETKTEENQLKMEQDVVENEPKKGEPVKPSPTDKGKNKLEDAEPIETKTEDNQTVENEPEKEEGSEGAISTEKKIPETEANSEVENSLKINEKPETILPEEKKIETEKKESKNNSLTEKDNVVKTEEKLGAPEEKSTVVVNGTSDVQSSTEAELKQGLGNEEVPDAGQNDVINEKEVDNNLPEEDEIGSEASNDDEGFAMNNSNSSDNFDETNSENESSSNIEDQMEGSNELEKSSETKKRKLNTDRENSENGEPEIKVKCDRAETPHASSENSEYDESTYPHPFSAFLSQLPDSMDEAGIKEFFSNNALGGIIEVTIRTLKSNGKKSALIFFSTEEELMAAVNVPELKMKNGIQLKLIPSFGYKPQSEKGQIWLQSKKEASTIAKLKKENLMLKKQIAHLKTQLYVKQGAQNKPVRSVFDNVISQIKGHGTNSNRAHHHSFTPYQSRKKDNANTRENQNVLHGNGNALRGIFNKNGKNRGNGFEGGMGYNTTSDRGISRHGGRGRGLGGWRSGSNSEFSNK